MDAIIRTLAMYFFLLVVFRLAGKRSLDGWMKRARVDESDVLTAAREAQGLERLDQIKYAILERSDGISIIPKEK